MLFDASPSHRYRLAGGLTKLYLQDRTQAAVYAWREGFVRRDPNI